MTKDLVFIVSGGRTGTQSLGDEISKAIPGSFSEHEPDLFDPSELRPLRRIAQIGLWNGVIGKLAGRRGIRTVGTLRIKGKLDPSEAARRIERTRKKYHESIEASLIIESNSQWHLAVDEIETIWPLAKIAVIIRDPRTWIRSWLNKGTRWRWNDLPRWLPPGRPTPRSVGDTSCIRDWRSLDTFGRLAWEWRFVYSNLDQLVHQRKATAIFRFEDLFDSNQPEHVHQLIKFCAEHRNRSYPVEIPSGFLETAANSSTGKERDWRFWTKTRCRVVELFCGDLMARYGYGMEPEWTEKLQRP